eukprot:2081977-Prymnesium_polylepis.1
MSPAYSAFAPLSIKARMDGKPATTVMILGSSIGSRALCTNWEKKDFDARTQLHMDLLFQSKGDDATEDNIDTSTWTTTDVLLHNQPCQNWNKTC